MMPPDPPDPPATPADRPAPEDAAARDEQRRLQALRELQVLDSLPEAVFDAITDAAAEACGVPIALVSLVDEHRQWFKSNRGLDGVAETPRDVAFCDHAIRGHELLEVGDAGLDPRFAANPLVTGAPGIRFYAGAPIALPGGERIGTVCVIDRRPRELDDAQRSMMRHLGRVASAVLTDRRRQVETTQALLRSEERQRALAEERRLAKQRLREALTEKETLLKEVYHRVKNNLQVVQSLLSLQQRSTADAAARHALAESSRRVRAMALVHEKLYQSGSLAVVSLPGYLADLLRQLDEAGGGAARGIAISGDCAPIDCGLDGAIPFGLVVTELVSNALEHGFAGERRGGRIDVVLDRPDGVPRLSVRDDGAGLAPGFDLQQSAQMGLQLAASLVAQLGGELQAGAGTAGGACFSAPLPRLPAARRETPA